MIKTNIRRIGLLFLILALALLSGWIVTINEKWILAFPILGLAVIIIFKPFWGLLLFAMLIPLESSFLSLGGGAASVTRILGVFIFGAWFLRDLINHRKISVPFDLKLVITFLLWGCLSLIWAFSKSATTSRILTAVQLLLLTFLIINMINNQKKLTALLDALFIGCLIVTFLGYVGIGVESNTSLLTLQNQGAKEYGCYVGIVFLIGSILFIFERNHHRWLGFAAVAFSIVPLIRVNERGIFLAIGLAWVTIALITRQKVKTFIFIALLVLIINVLPDILVNQGVISGFNAERLTIQNIIETGGTGRTYIWEVGLKMFTSNPIVGTGWGNFPVVINQYANQSVNGTDPHMDLMGVAGELGIIGVVLFLIMYGRILFQNIAIFVKCSNTRNNILAILVISLLVYIFAAGFTSTFLWRKVYWIILGMGILIPKLLEVKSTKNIVREISTKIESIH